MNIETRLKDKIFNKDVIEADTEKIKEYIEKFDIEFLNLESTFIKEGYLKLTNHNEVVYSYFKNVEGFFYLKIYLDDIDVYIDVELNNENVANIELTDKNIERDIIEIFRHSKMDLEKLLDNVVQDFLMSMNVINFVATHIKETVTSTKVKVNSNNKNNSSNKPKSKSKSSKNKVSLINKIYLNKVSLSEEEVKKYKRHMLSWSVRGHYRTYKSGKRIWIDGFKKGNGEINSKIYKI